MGGGRLGGWAEFRGTVVQEAVRPLRREGGRKAEPGVRRAGGGERDLGEKGGREEGRQGENERGRKKRREEGGRKEGGRREGGRKQGEMKEGGRREGGGVEKVRGTDLMCCVSFFHVM